MQLEEIRKELALRAPALARHFFDKLAPSLLPKDAVSGKLNSKTFNDPVWNNINLPQNAVEILETPLMQRLRYVRQLGVAHILYPGAHHSRLEHCIGCAHAAGQMFDIFNEYTETKLEPAADIRLILICAALLHDCGHAAFSHSSENILEDWFPDEWRRVRLFLGEVFPPVALPCHGQDNKTANALSSGAAELASLLFVFSPSFEHQIAKLGWGKFSVPQAISAMGALIVGRPPQYLIHDKSGNQHNYLGKIISGDMDADKLDYVSRDAYYAGLTVSVDTARLLGQLRPVKVTETTPGAIENGFVFPPDGPKAYYLFGIAPSGISTLEMFVMTRSYLFNRIYSHHKVNAAEMVLERILGLWVAARMKINEADSGWMDYLYGKSGDDGLLALIGNFPGLNLQEPPGISKQERQDIDDTWRELAARISDFLDRRLPYRALAISARSLELSEANQAEWNKVVDKMGNFIFEKTFNRKLKKCMESLCEEKMPEVYVCSHKQNPVKENPAIWVATQNDQILSRATHYFNPEQLANAYRDTKLTQWIFCESAEKLAAAAAAAKIFFEEFNILPGHEAFEQCKLSRKRVVDFLKSSKDSSAKEFAKKLANPTDYTKFCITSSFWEDLFGFMSVNSRTNLYDKFTNQFNKTNLSRYYADDLSKAKHILKVLTEHANACWGMIKFDTEKAMQAHLKDFLLNSPGRNFEVYEHCSKSGGYTDILITFHDGGKQFIIELKNSGSTASSSFNSHAGQSAAYAGASDVSPISFLYTTFEDSSGAAKLCDSLEIRQSSSPRTPHIIFCLGLMSKTSNPSSLGRENKIIS